MDWPKRLAHHTALIDRSTLERWLHEGAHALRSLFALAQHYRYSGTQRSDYAENNAAAQAAIEKFGALPQEVIDGTRRSRFAPPLRRRTPLPLQDPPAPPEREEDPPALEAPPTSAADEGSDEAPQA